MRMPPTARGALALASAALVLTARGGGGGDPLNSGSGQSSGAAAPSGHLVYDDKSGTKVKEESVTRLVITGNRALIYGTARVNGQSGYQFQVEVVDNGEPGSSDTFRLTLTKTAITFQGTNLQMTGNSVDADSRAITNN